MKIFLVERTDDWDYDEYLSFVCCAENAHDARHMYPGGGNYSFNHDKHRWEDSDGDTYCSWTNDLGSLEVTEIGTSNEPFERVIHTHVHHG